MTTKAQKFAQSCKNNPGTDTPGGSAVEKCPLSLCEVAGMVIRCKHSEDKARPYALDLTKPPNHNNSEHVLQVISQSTQPDVVTVTVAGDCQQGHGCKTDASDAESNYYRSNPGHCCPSVDIRGNHARIDQTSPVKVAVLPADKPVTDKSLLGYIKNYLTPTLEPTIYTVQSKKCGGDARFKGQIHAFPPFSAKGEVKIGYEQPGPSNRLVMDQKKGFKNLLTKGSWIFEGVIACQIDGHKWNVTTKPKSGDGPAHKQDEVADGAFGGLLSMLDQYLPFLSAAIRESEASSPDKPGIVDLQINWPRIGLSVDTKLVECQNDYAVDLESKITLNLQLININLTIDLIPLLLKATGPYALIIQKIRDAAEEGYESRNFEANAVVQMDISINGEAGGEATIIKKPRTEWSFEKLTIKAGVGFTAKGRIEGKGRAFIVVVASGLEVVLAGKDAADKPSAFTGEYTPVHGEQHPTLAGQLTFNGLAVYITAYIEFGVKADESGKKSNIKKTLNKKTALVKEESLKDKHEYDKKYVFIEPFSWPSAKKDTARKDKISSSNITSILSGV